MKGKTFFHDYVSGVTPLAPRNRAQFKRAWTQRTGAPDPESADRTEAPVSDYVPLALSEDGELKYLRNGMAQRTLRQLRRRSVEDELDLHGLTIAQARPLLAEFLTSCIHEDVRCVRIIHGKGLRSKGGEPVLKMRVASWLSQRAEVLAFCQARPSKGGGGAVIVLLSASKSDL